MSRAKVSPVQVERPAAEACSCVAPSTVPAIAVSLLKPKRINSGDHESPNPTIGTGGSKRQ